MRKERPLVPPTLKELIKFRNYLPSREMAECDRRILEGRQWHPDIAYVLANIGWVEIPNKPMPLRDRNRLVDVTRWLQIKLEMD